MIAMFLWNNALLLFLSARLPRRLLPGASPSHRFLATVLCVPLVAILAILVTSAVGWLTSISVAVLLAVLAIVELLLPAPVCAGDDAQQRSLAENAIEVAGAALLGGVVALWVCDIGIGGTSFLFDDLTYHATSSAWWLQQATLSLPPFTYQGYYPHNAELMNLWFMLPLRADTYANLSILLWIALSVSAVFAITRTFAASRGLACFVAAALLASPEIRFFSGSFSGSDLAATGFGLAALALAFLEAGDDERTRFGKALLAGLAAGAAAGTKVSMLAPMALLLLWWCWRAGSSSAGSRRRELLVFVAGLVATGSFWYVRNWILAGNPLFPAEIGPFDGPFDRASQWTTSLASHMAAKWDRPRFALTFLRPQLLWPLPLGLTSALGYGCALGAALLWREHIPERLRPYALLLATAGLLAFLLFPFQPFSGTINRPGAVLNIRVRFLSFAFALGLTLYAAVGPRKPAGAALAALLPAYGIFVALRDIDGRDGLLIAVGATLTAVIAVATRQWPVYFAGRSLRVAAWGATGLALIGLALWAPVKALRSDENLQSFEVGKRSRSTPAWAALSQLPPGSRVAGISFNPTSHAFYYPLFGRSYQLDVVPIDRAGLRRQALHAPAESDRSWWWEFGERSLPPVPTLLENLRQSEIDYLFISRWPRTSNAAGWPPARDALATRLPDESRIYGDGDTEIWELGRPAAGGGLAP